MANAQLEPHLLSSDLRYKPAAHTGGLYLLIAPHPAVDRLVDALAARLALARAGSPRPYLHILDGGNRFDLHGIARGLARGIDGSSVQVEAILQRITVARAFTCFQVEALLAGYEDAVVVGAGLRPAPTMEVDSPLHNAAAVLAPGLLTTFADENVPRNERLRLLLRCIQHLKRLAQQAPVLVSAAPWPDAVDAANAEAAGFLNHMETAADQVWRFEAAATRGAGRRGSLSSVPGQPRLF